MVGRVGGAQQILIGYQIIKILGISFDSSTENDKATGMGVTSINSSCLSTKSQFALASALVELAFANKNYENNGICTCNRQLHKARK